MPHGAARPDDQPSPTGRRRPLRAIVLAIAVAVAAGAGTAGAVRLAAIPDRDTNATDDGPIDWGPSYLSKEDWEGWRWWREQAPKEVARLEADPLGFEVPQPHWIPPAHELMRAVPSEVTAIEVATRDATIGEVTIDPATRDRIVTKDITMDWAAVDEEARSLDHWIRIQYFPEVCPDTLPEDADAAYYWEDGRIERVRFDNGEWVFGRASTKPLPDDPEGGILADAGSWQLRTCLGGRIKVMVSADPSVTLDTLRRMLGSIPGRASVRHYEARLR